MTVQVNDWVRFYQGGKLVIGVVQYLGRTKYGGDPQASTDIGDIAVAGILEVRAALRSPGEEPTAR